MTGSSQPLKNIPARERLIFALDVSDRAQALAWIDHIGDSAAFYKIGLELLAGGDYFAVLDELAQRDKKIFVDLKLHDVPATVAGAVRGLARWPVAFCTVHCDSRAMLEAAAAAKANDLRLLAVTVLTSNDQADLAALGVTDELADVVVERARLAQAAGIDGVVCSGADLPRLRAALGPDLLTVCPGIRPSGPAGDDQKRIVDVHSAFTDGADYIVVGRPIRQAADPRAMAETMVAQISDTLASLS
ncbi:MAG: orotidine-5'-phosphate decarboxylase [Rhodanobacteraceae bacterium]